MIDNRDDCVLITEERTGLLARPGSVGDVSTRLCEIEDSDDEQPPAAPAPARAAAPGATKGAAGGACRHTDV